MDKSKEDSICELAYEFPMKDISLKIH